jgi:hypothetical protein
MRQHHASEIEVPAPASGAQALAPPVRRSAVDSTETALDDAIAASFPASDPPSWTTGTATIASAPPAS